jgi:hypothetical protein
LDFRIRLLRRHIEQASTELFWDFKKSRLRAFWVLFSGISTASNLSRTQPRPVGSRGLFLFRRPASEVKERPKDPV